MKFNSVSEVWDAIDAGKTVYWSSKAYKVFVEPDLMPERTKELDFRQYAERNGSILAVRYIENYFGSIISPYYIGNLFTED
jgi:hypothetical protein